MDHLEFVNKLHVAGIGSLHIKNCLIRVNTGINMDNDAKIENGKCTFVDKEYFHDPLKKIIQKAIDMDTWKHSWHNEIVPDNYEKFIDIIQNKILDRAFQINELMLILNQIRREISHDEGR